MRAGNVQNAEIGIMDAIASMLARPDFLIPLVAAERQFRDHYYGLNSAALLEDLFFDALGNFLRQTAPETDLSRPAPGQKGWDYSYAGLRLSHKVSQRADVIGALWDATKKGVTTWSFEDPVVYVLGGHTPKTSVEVEFALGDRTSAMAAADLKSPYGTGGKTLLVVKWPGDGRAADLLDIVPTQKGQTLSEALSFTRIWKHVAEHVRVGGAANEIDVLVTRTPLPAARVAALQNGLPRPCSISVAARGGVYLFARDLLQDLAVTSNNRGILIPKQTVLHLLTEAHISGLFAPLPLWYWAFAQERPPDLFSVQRAEYDARFSARGDLDRV